MIPKLHLPNLIQNCIFKNQNNLLNLKDVLKAHISQYYHTARNTLTRHETLRKTFSIFKISAVIRPIFGIIIISVIIYLCCRTKKIGQLVSLLSISKATNALPISEFNDEWDYEFGAFTSVVIIIILLIVYLSIRYYKLGRRVFNHLALPFTECISARRQIS